MTSIIITSVNQTFLKQVKENIEKTIGSEYELVEIDNRENKYSIFQAYNLGVSKAKGDILCFAHEDILFHTNNWGKKVENHFYKNENLGMIGVVGGDYYPKMPAPWWSNEEINTHYVNLIQHWRGNVPERKYRERMSDNKTREYNNPNNANAEDVIAVDGLWFCIRRDLFQSISFDDNTYDGFHFYDADLSMQVYQAGYKTQVVFDILIEHFSPGTLSKGWFISAQVFSKKWSKLLPVGVQNKQYDNTFELKTLLTYAYWMQSAEFPKSDVKNMINYLLPIIKSNYKSIEFWQLKIWSIIGYQYSRIPIYLIKKII